MLVITIFTITAFCLFFLIFPAPDLYKQKEKEVKDLRAKIAELLACMPTAAGGSASGSRVNAPVTSLASYVGNENNPLSLDLPATTDLSFGNSGKLSSGLGLNNLEDKLAGLYTPASLGGTAYNPKSNGNSLD